jgi:hypothetical protein
MSHAAVSRSAGMMPAPPEAGTVSRLRGGQPPPGEVPPGEERRESGVRRHESLRAAGGEQGAAQRGVDQARRHGEGTAVLALLTAGEGAGVEVAVRHLVLRTGPERGPAA